jgi:rod shape determining protein RodA
MNVAEPKTALKYRVANLNWALISLIITLSAIGFAMLYSAGEGSLEPWLIKQLMFFAISFPMMIFIAVIDMSLILRFAYIGYGAILIFIIIVDIMGHSAMGATRWFKLGFITFQPSEVMKVFLVLALAKYFHGLEQEEISRTKYVIPPILMIALPAFFIFNQPDLGTALILTLVGVSVLFVAGVERWKFIVALIVGAVSVPFMWIFLLYDYQKQRVLTFLDPSRDALGSGYNIIQSKIAIGSGGFAGKGYLNGTQGQLNFLPEKQTDFIFTMLSEELGFIGSFFTIATCLGIVFLSANIAHKIEHQYGKIIAIGISNIFFIHFFINIGMAIGLLPVVGAPLPLVSYGGTITVSMLLGFGLILNADLYKNLDPKKNFNFV